MRINSVGITDRSVLGIVCFLELGIDDDILLVLGSEIVVKVKAAATVFVLVPTDKSIALLFLVFLMHLKYY